MLQVRQETPTGYRAEIPSLLMPFSIWLNKAREIDGEIVETVSDFIFLGSKITADGDCSHEIKRRLLLGNGNLLQYSCLENSMDREA